MAIFDTRIDKAAFLTCRHYMRHAGVIFYNCNSQGPMDTWQQTDTVWTYFTCLVSTTCDRYIIPYLLFLLFTPQKQLLLQNNTSVEGNIWNQMISYAGIEGNGE